MENLPDFHTLKGYKQADDSPLTASMEDYLEMICRLLFSQEVVRIGSLARQLNVKPSSASKMVANLRLSGLVSFEKYGYIKLTPKGRILGEYLLYRHNVLNEFLCYINESENETEQAEKIEHFLDKKTVNNIKRLVDRLKSKI